MSKYVTIIITREQATSMWVDDDFDLTDNIEIQLSDEQHDALADAEGYDTETLDFKAIGATSAEVAAYHKVQERRK